MKQTLFYNSILTWSEYLVVYLIKTFIIWEFTDPFRWIIDIPTYSAMDRSGILFAIVFWQVVQIICIHNSKEGTAS